MSRESSSVSAPKIPTPPITANAVWIISSSANISFNLSEIDLSLSGLWDDDCSSSRSSASWSNWALLSFNWNAGIEFTLSWISRILSWDKFTSWEETLTENSAINIAMPPKKLFLLLFMLCP